MIKKILIALPISLMLLITPLAMPSLQDHVYAFNPLSGACSGKASTSASCTAANGQGGNDPVGGPNGLIAKASNIIAIVAGIGAVIMIFIGGFQFIASAGNAESAAKARKRITAAVVGLVIVVLAWAIVRFVVDRLIKT